VNIYEGFKPIAHRDQRGMPTTTISFNPATKKFLLVVAGKAGGPFSLDELKSLLANITDVIDLGGRYLYIDGFSANGERIDE